MTHSQAAEIVIVRRRRSTEEGAHGGVWKVAFADFMTAMMAFFLVLWIVNSTSKETRSSVARYFNPIKLADTTPARKGLQDPRESDFDAASQASRDQGPAKQPTESEISKTGEPPSKATSQKAGTEKLPTEASQSGHTTASPGSIPKVSAEPNETSGLPERGSLPTNPSSLPPKVVANSQPKPMEESRTTSTDMVLPSGPHMREQKDPETILDPAAKATPSPGFVDIGIKPEFRAALKSLRTGFASSSHSQANGVTVEAQIVKEGLLLSLLDHPNRQMFHSSSSKLTYDALQTMKVVAESLKSLEADIIIAGYTDSKPFKSGRGSNWRLSILRAESAMRALLSYGVSERRIEKIEGQSGEFSASRITNSKNVNRRIDILLRVGSR